MAIESSNTIESVGLGVDLIGGPEVLANLRLIRNEYEAIASLSGRGPSGPPGGGARGPITQAELNQQRQVAQAQITLARDTSNQELDILSRAEARKTSQRAEIKRRSEQILADERVQTSRLLSERRERIRQVAQTDDILFRDFGAERSSFRRHRNDPARDPQTNIYRSQLSEDLQAQRLAQQFDKTERDRLSQEIIASEAARAKLRQAELDKIAETERAREIERNRLPNLLSRGRAGSLAYQNPDRPLTRPALSQAAAQRAELRAHLERGGTLANFNPGGGGPPESGGGGEDEEGGGGKGGGFLGPVGRLTRNFLIYRALTGLTFGLVRYTEASLSAAKATTEQANALKFATEESQGNLNANRALAQQIETVGFNRAQAAQTVAAAARATFRHPELTGALTREAIDIAALRGGGLQETPRIIEDIIGGRQRAYREYFNITPEEIYKQEGRRRAAQQTSTFGLRTVGKQNYETEEQQVSRYVAALTEEEKEQLRLNYVLSQSYRFQGDAAERAGTLAGKMDLVSAAFFNASANVGAFIADIKPVKEILDQIAGNAPGGVFTPPVLAQGGPRNTITDANILSYGAESATGTRATTLNFISRLTSGIANNITPANTLATLQRASGINPINPFSPGTSSVSGISDQEYDKLITENIARDKQQRQRSVLREQGQLGYRDIRKDSYNAPNEYFTYQQLTARGLPAGFILKNYIEDIKPVLDEGSKSLAEYNEKYKALQSTIDKDKGLGFENKSAKEQQNLLTARRDFEFISGFKPADYDVEAQKREDTRKQKEEKERGEYVSQVGGALNKLRDAQQGAFRLPGEIATNLVGEQNPFVRALSDQYTAAERMRQQWGFLGKSAVDYFTTIEKRGISRQLNQLDFQAYTTASTLRGQSARETAERSEPGVLSRRDQEYLNIQQAIVDRASQIPNLWKQAADVLKITLGPQDDLLNRISSISRAFGVQGPISGPNIYDTNIFNAKKPIPGGNPLYQSPLGQLQAQRQFGNPILLPGGQEQFQRQFGNPLYQTVRNPFAGVGEGQSPEVKQAIQKSFSDTLLDAFKNFSPAQIRAAGLQDYYLSALKVQAGSLNYNIQQARAKAEFGAGEDARLSQQLQQDEAFRRQQISAGYDAKDVGRESDALLLSRTQGVPTKDLTLEQFTGRQEALRRQADRAEQDRNEARAAVEQGLKYQAALLLTVEAIRTKLVNGDLSMLVQVQNDTQARIDQQALNELGSGKYHIPLDTGEVRSSPYTDSFDKYGRGGRKR